MEYWSNGGGERASSTPILQHSCCPRRSRGLSSLCFVLLPASSDHKKSPVRHQYPQMVPPLIRIVKRRRGKDIPSGNFHADTPPTYGSSIVCGGPQIRNYKYLGIVKYRLEQFSKNHLTIYLHNDKFNSHHNSVLLEVIRNLRR